MPAGLTADPAAHDAWFRAKVQEALADSGPTHPHAKVIDEAHALIEGKRRCKPTLEWRDAARSDQTRHR